MIVCYVLLLSLVVVRNKKYNLFLNKEGEINFNKWILKVGYGIFNLE